MVNFKEARVNTAGAYVMVGGLYAFTIGWKLHNGNIPVVRLGGHVEGHESGWECALREVWEEACIHIRPLLPERTHWIAGEEPVINLRETAWDHESPYIPKPLLATVYQAESCPLLSLMYLAESDDLPTPSSEVKGILLLDPPSIKLICEQSITLGQYLQNGGQAIFNDRFDPTRTLEPFLQLRALAQILKQRESIT